MGRETQSTTIRASVSRHNSEQDEIDDALWEEIRNRIDVLIREPRYRNMYPSSD